MRYIFYIFALLFLSCQEVTIEGVRKCGTMTFSDALPIQWWLADCETYNEQQTEENGVHTACWCQPWLCSKEIVTQFLHPEDFGVPTVRLLAESQAGVIKEIGAFDGIEVSDGVWMYTQSFTPEEEDLCDGQYRLFTVTGSNIISSAPTEDWTNDNDAWAYQANNRFTFEPPANSCLSYLEFSPNLQADGSMTIPVTLDVTTIDPGESLTFQIYLADALGNNLDGIVIIRNTLGAVTQNITLTVPEGEIASRLYVTLIQSGGTNAADIYLFDDHEIDVPPLVVLAVNESDVLSKTDCLDIRETHTEAVSFVYSNHRNFSGIIYENQSPDLSFNILIPCRFFHQKFPQEDEGLDLTTGIVVTSSNTKTQRKLQVKHSPYYFHKKVIQILQHQSVYALRQYWKKQDAYDIPDATETWPLKRGIVMLTEDNSIVRNVV